MRPCHQHHRSSMASTSESADSPSQKPEQHDQDDVTTFKTGTHLFQEAGSTAQAINGRQAGWLGNDNKIAEGIKVVLVSQNNAGVFTELLAGVPL